MPAIGASIIEFLEKGAGYAAGFLQPLASGAKSAIEDLANSVFNLKTNIGDSEDASDSFLGSIGDYFKVIWDNAEEIGKNVMKSGEYFFKGVIETLKNIDPKKAFTFGKMLLSLYALKKVFTICILEVH